MDRKTAILIFYLSVIIIFIYSLLGFYNVIYKERYYLDIYFLIGALFFSLLGYFWEPIMAFFKVNNKLYWIAFTLFFFFLYLAKESISFKARSFFIANIFTYLVVALRGLYDFFKKGYHISPNGKKEK